MKYLFLILCLVGVDCFAHGHCNNNRSNFNGHNVQRFNNGGNDVQVVVGRFGRTVVRFRN